MNHVDRCSSRKLTQTHFFLCVMFAKKQHIWTITPNNILTTPQRFLLRLLDVKLKQHDTEETFNQGYSRLFLQGQLSCSDARCQHYSSGTTIHSQIHHKCAHTRPCATPRPKLPYTDMRAQNSVSLERTDFISNPQQRLEDLRPPLVLFLLRETRLRGRRE